jgi:ferredoxin
MYIQPRECIDCGACEVVCPVTAIASDLQLTDANRPWRDDNAAFFDVVLPGRSEPLGAPGGASTLGPIPADAPLAAVTPGSGAQ